jgi:hypothetical protein
MDTTKLLKALDNDSNEQILNFTTKKIIETNLSILKELHLTNKDTLEYMITICHKTEWIKEAIDLNFFNTTNFTWIDRRRYWYCCKSLKINGCQFKRCES